MSLLSAKNLGYSFDYPLFENVSFDIDECGSVAVLGVSGSGKSTLLHILSTFLKPQTGQVFFEGRDIFGLGQKEILAIRRQSFGIIFQFHYLFRGFSAEENIKVASLLSKKDTDYTLVNRFKVKEVISHNIGTLSGGQQQRISIVRVLTKKPRMIFADEPTGNLDKQTAKDVMDTIFEYIYENRAGLFLVTHDEQTAMRCDKVFRIESGQLISIK